MSLPVSNQLISGLTEDVKWPKRPFPRVSDKRDGEGVSHVTESLDKGQISTNKTISLSALFLLAPKFHSAEIGAKCRKCYSLF